MPTWVLVKMEVVSCDPALRVGWHPCAVQALFFALYLTVFRARKHDSDFTKGVAAVSWSSSKSSLACPTFDRKTAGFRALKDPLVLSGSDRLFGELDWLGAWADWRAEVGQDDIRKESIQHAEDVPMEFPPFAAFVGDRFLPAPA